MKVKYGNINIEFKDKGLVFFVDYDNLFNPNILNALLFKDKLNMNIRFNNNDLTNLTKNKEEYFKKNIIDVIDENNFLKFINIKQNFLLWSKKDNFKAVIKKFGLNETKKKKIKKLKKEEKLKLLIASSISKNNRILVIKDLEKNMTKISILKILDMLYELSNDKLIIILTKEKEYALNYADSFYEFKNNKLINDIKFERNNFENYFYQTGKDLMMRENLLYTEVWMNEIKNVLKIDNEIALKVKSEEDFFSHRPPRKIITNFHYVEKEAILQNKPIKGKKLCKLSLYFLKRKKIFLLVYILFSIVLLSYLNGAFKYKDNKLKDLNIDSDFPYAFLEKKDSELSINDYNNLSKVDLEFITAYKNFTINYKDEELYQIYDKDIYKYDVNRLIAYSEDLFEKLNYKIYGRLPAEKNEIAIPYYLYSFLQHEQVRKLKPMLTLITIEEYMNKLLEENPYLLINDSKYYITAIIDTEVFKGLEINILDTDNEKLNTQLEVFHNRLNSGLHTAIFINLDAVNEITILNDYISSRDLQIFFYNGQNKKQEDILIVNEKTKFIEDCNTIFFQQNQINDKEIIININRFVSFFNNVLGNKLDEHIFKNIKIKEEDLVLEMPLDISFSEFLYQKAAYISEQYLIALYNDLVLKGEILGLDYNQFSMKLKNKWTNPYDDISYNYIYYNEFINIIKKYFSIIVYLLPEYNLTLRDVKQNFNIVGVNIPKKESYFSKDIFILNQKKYHDILTDKCIDKNHYEGMYFLKTENNIKEIKKFIAQNSEFQFSYDITTIDLFFQSYDNHKIILCIIAYIFITLLYFDSFYYSCKEKKLVYQKGYDRRSISTIFFLRMLFIQIFVLVASIYPILFANKMYSKFVYNKLGFKVNFLPFDKLTYFLTIVFVLLLSVSIHIIIEFTRNKKYMIDFGTMSRKSKNNKIALK